MSSDTPSKTPGRRPRSLSAFSRAVVLGLASLAVRIVFYGAAYQAVSFMLQKPAFPPVSSVLQALLAIVTSSDVQHFKATLVRWLEMFGIGVGIAVPLGLVLGHNPKFYSIIEPDVDMMRSLPATVLSSFVFAAFGDGGPQRGLPALYISFFTVLFLVSKNAANASGSRRRHLEELGAGRLFLVKHWLIPENLPSILVAVRQSASLSLLVLISIELIVGPNKGVGVGRLLYDWSDSIPKYSKILATLIIIALFGYAVNRIMRMIYELSTTWMEPAPGQLDRLD